MQHLFSLKKPCANCPFHKNKEAIHLMPGRREGIMKGLLRGDDNNFPCHKTVYRPDGRNHDDDGSYTPTDVSVCPGAAAVAKKFGRDMVFVQLAERMGFIEPGHYDQAMEDTLEPEDLDLDPRECHLPASGDD